MSATIPLEEVRNLTISVYRFDPNKDKKAYMEDIEIEVPVNETLWSCNGGVKERAVAAL